MTVLGCVRIAAVPLLGVTTAMALCGCAHYEYRLVEPATASPLIGKEPVAVACPPLQYSLARRGDHVVVRITNPTGQSVTLLPGRSYVVDPLGESHPVRGLSLGPHSYVPLLLPPLQPRVVGYYAPYWGYGPMDVGGYPFWGPYFWPYPPTYAYSYRLHSPYFWHWKQGRVRLHLGYQSAGNAFDQDLVFDRNKVK